MISMHSLPISWHHRLGGCDRDAEAVPDMSSACGHQRRLHVTRRKRRNGETAKRWDATMGTKGHGVWDWIRQYIYKNLYISIDAPSPIHIHIYIYTHTHTTWVVLLWRLDMLDSMYLLDETTAIVDSIFLTSSFSSGSSEHFMASFLDDFWCLFPPKKKPSSL